MEQLRALQSGLDREFDEFKRTASQATTFADKAAGLLAAQFADVTSEQLSAQVGKAFAKVDLDGNGMLDRDEIKVAFAGLFGRRLAGLRIPGVRHFSYPRMFASFDSSPAAATSLETQLM